MPTPAPIARGSRKLALLVVLCLASVTTSARAELKGTYRLALLRVTYSDTTPLYTTDQLNKAASELESYFDQLSNHNLKVEVKVADVGTFGRSKAYYWTPCTPSGDPRIKCPDLIQDVAQIAAVGGAGIDFTKIDGIVVLNTFCGGDVTVGPVDIDRPRVKGRFQRSYDFECARSLPAPGPSGVSWGWWAHEIGHQLELFDGVPLGGAWNGHPSGYASGYERACQRWRRGRSLGSASPWRNWRSRWRPPPLVGLWAP